MGTVRGLAYKVYSFCALERAIHELPLQLGLGWGKIWDQRYVCFMTLMWHGLDDKKSKRQFKIVAYFF